MIKILKFSLLVFFVSFTVVTFNSCREIQAQPIIDFKEEHKETKDSLMVLKEQLINKTEKIKKNNKHMEEKIISFDKKIKKINNP